MVLYRESQRRYLALFAEYVDIDTGRVLDKGFESDVEYWRHKEPEFLDFGELTRAGILTQDVEWEDFLNKYSFNGAMADFVGHFIRWGEIRPELINSGMYIVSEADDTAAGRDAPPEIVYKLYKSDSVSRGGGKPAEELKLVIPAGVTQTQVKDFIQEHWKDFISLKQEMYRDNLDQSSGRVKGSRSVMKARVLELDRNGTPHSEIASIINHEFKDKSYTYHDIDQIVYLSKKSPLDRHQK